MIPAEAQFDPGQVLLYYQRHYLGILAKHSVVLVEKSRRVGISFADALDSVLLAASSKDAGGMDCFYIGYNHDMAREYIEACADWAKSMKRALQGTIEEVILHDEDKEITVFRIRFPSGYKIEALSSRPSNLRGKQGKVTIDEAAYHEDLPGLIKAAIALLMWGGRVVIISTHEGEDNPFNELVLEARSGKSGYHVLRITFQDALAQGLYRRICQVQRKPWTPEAEANWAAGLYKFYGDNAAEELDVIPSGGTGIYLTRALLERQMRAETTVLRYAQKPEFTVLAADERETIVQAWCEEHLLPVIQSLNPHLAHYLGEDFARTGDLTSFVVGEQRPDMGLDTVLVVELRGMPFEQQRQILFYLLDRLPIFVKGAFDSGGNGQYLAEVATQRYGDETIESIKFSEGWYRDNMPKMKSYLEDGMLTIPKDADIISDFRLIKVTKGVAKVPADARTKGTDGQPRHGDTAVATALMVYASQAEAESFGYETVSTGGSPWRSSLNF